MRTNKLWLPVAFAFAAILTAGCHKAGSPRAIQSPQQEQQSGIAAKAYQINNSNLPPDQKQRLLTQIGAK